MIRVSSDTETNSDCSIERCLHSWSQEEGLRRNRGLVAKFKLFSKHMFENLKGFFKRKRNCVTKNKVTLISKETGCINGPQMTGVSNHHR